jgi:hypothetical protein
MVLGLRLATGRWSETWAYELLPRAQANTGVMSMKIW